MAMKKILIPVDGSAPAEHAFAYAVDLAKHTGAELLVTYVIDSGDTLYPRLQLAMMGEVIQAAQESAKEILEKLIASVHDENLTIQTKTEIGVPGPTLVDLIEKEKVDAVVMGNSGKGAISTFVMGSVSQYVIHRVTCPVTLVK